VSDCRLLHDCDEFGKCYWCAWESPKAATRQILPQQIQPLPEVNLPGRLQGEKPPPKRTRAQASLKRRFGVPPARATGGLILGLPSMVPPGGYRLLDLTGGRSK
jgi:hypothetical protein